MYRAAFISLSTPLNPTTMRKFDHILIGTGQATGTLIAGLLKAEGSIAIVEGHLLGGTCVNVGCTPTKTLVASARVAHLVGRSSDYGVVTDGFHIDFGTLMARMNRVRGDSNSGLDRWLSGEPRITIFRDWGRFVGPKQVDVGDETIEGERIYINAGARPRIPEIPGLDSVDWLDNSRILDLQELPRHLIIIGGGFVALEYAQMFRRFGSAVTLLQRGPQLISREDEDVSGAVTEILEDEGIRVLRNASVREVRGRPSGTVQVNVDHEIAQIELEGSHLLVAVGRVPNSDRLDSEQAGLRLDASGYIIVDDHCRTNIEGVFALGDINGRGSFTHTSVNDAEIVLDLSGDGVRSLADRIPTYALFIDPALGRVGLTEREALAAGYKVLKASRAMARIGRAKEMGETKGFAKLLVDGETDLILGGSILGVGGDEIINMFAAYMYSGLPCRTYRRSVLVHPTISELMPWVLDNLTPV